MSVHRSCAARKETGGCEYWRAKPSRKIMHFGSCRAQGFVGTGCQQGYGAQIGACFGSSAAFIQGLQETFISHCKSFLRKLLAYLTTNFKSYSRNMTCRGGQIWKADILQRADLLCSPIGLFKLSLDPVQTCSRGLSAVLLHRLCSVKLGGISLQIKMPLCRLTDLEVFCCCVWQ